MAGNALPRETGFRQTRSSTEQQIPTVKKHNAQKKAILASTKMELITEASLTSGRHNGNGGVDNEPSELDSLGGTAPWALTLAKHLKLQQKLS